jgi:hypothetical protein
MRRTIVVAAVGGGDVAGFAGMLERMARLSTVRVHPVLALDCGLTADQRSVLASVYPRVSFTTRRPKTAAETSALIFADADAAALVCPRSGGDGTPSWERPRLRVFASDAGADRLAKEMKRLRARTSADGAADLDALRESTLRLAEEISGSDGTERPPEIRIFYGLHALLSRPHDRLAALALAVLALRERCPRAAFTALRRDDFGPGPHRAAAEYHFGRALRQIGKFEEARRFLSASGKHAPAHLYRVHLELAETTASLGRLGMARRNIALAAAQRPGEPRLEAMEQKVELRRQLAIERLRAARHDHVLHVAAYQGETGNAGDMLVPLAPRWTIEHAAGGPLHWSPVHVHDRFGPDEIALANASRGVLLGGGGLFIPDSGQNSVSGWQWNADAETLRSIATPLVLSGVGYNRFYGQREFDPEFRDALAAVVDHAAFVGIRNRGSMRALSSYLPPELVTKLSWHPCGTTVLSRLAPTAGARSREPFVALNCALDRSSLRLGAGYDHFVRELARAVSVVGRAIPVVYYAHNGGDASIWKDLCAELGSEIECVDLASLGWSGIVERYRRPSLCIGMRGHAIMIPFGLGVPTISLISHPKLRFFLEDTDGEETGLDADEPALGEKLSTLALSMLGSLDEAEAAVQRAQAPIWETLVGNNGRIAALFGYGAAASPQRQPALSV